MAALAVNGRAGSGGQRSRDWPDGAVLHVRHAGAAAEDRARRRRRFFSSPAPTRSPKSTRGVAIRKCWRWRTSSSSRGRAIRSRAARAAAGAGGTDARGRRTWANQSRRFDTAWRRLDILLVDAATPDVSSTDVRRRLRSAASRLPGSYRHRSKPTFRQHRLYARHEAGARLGRFTCMTKKRATTHDNSWQSETAPE